MVEVGDILASRLRMLSTGIKENNFKVARHVLVYHAQDHSLVPEEVLDDAIRIEEIEHKRAQRLSKTQSGKRDR